MEYLHVTNTFKLDNVKKEKKLKSIFLFVTEMKVNGEPERRKYNRTLDCEQLGLRVFYKTSKNFEGILT
jgi:hypothetical protein